MLYKFLILWHNKKNKRKGEIMARNYVLGEYIISFCIKGDERYMIILKNQQGEMYSIYKTDDVGVIKTFLNVCQQIVGE